MSANTAIATAAMSVPSKDRRHDGLLVSGYVVAIALITALAIYGFNYYTLASADRPFSPKHALLKPGGAIGLKLGFLGFGIFLVIFLYPLRKRWKWLSRQGLSRHWLDFHVLLGLAAPFVIAFHASFKFGGFAGIAFWIMLAVSVSGIVGRYLYSQIPRSLNAAELSLKELQEVQARLAQQLQEQKLLPQADLQSLLRLPSPERVQRLPIVVALVYMVVLDGARFLRIAKLRRHTLQFSEKLQTLGGLLPARHANLEKIISQAREEAALAKRVLFLSRSRQVFNLWHVIHKPFSYSFALLALIHVVAVMMMGYF
jgi:hypothetical protein